MPNIASFLRTLLGRNVSRARSLRDMPNKPMFERGMAGPKLPNTRDIDMLRGQRSDAWTRVGAGAASAGMGAGIMKLLGGDDAAPTTPTPAAPAPTPAPEASGGMGADIMAYLKGLSPTQMGIGAAGLGLAGLGAYGGYKALTTGDEDEEDAPLRKTSHVMTPAYIEEFAKACRDAGIEKSAAGILLRCAAEARSPAWAVKAANWRERGIDPVWAGIVALKCGRSKSASAFKSSLPLMSDSGDGGALKANFAAFLKHPLDETRRLFNGGTLPSSGKPVPKPTFKPAPVKPPTSK